LSRITILSDDLTEKIYTYVCKNCENAPCIEVCPANAIYIDKKQDIVKIDLKKCTKCKLCIKACPYNALKFNEKLNKILKCEFCGGDPICVKRCPAEAISIC